MKLIYDIDPEFFAERAAIRELDGGMTLAEARIAAMRDVEDWQPTEAKSSLPAGAE